MYNNCELPVYKEVKENINKIYMLALKVLDHRILYGYNRLYTFIKHHFPTFFHIMRVIKRKHLSYT